MTFKREKRPARARRFSDQMSLDYLVGDGLAMFEFEVVVVVDEVFECVAVEFDDMFDDMFEVEFDGAVVVVEDEFVTVVEVAFEFIVLAGLLAVLLAVSPPQAAPRAVKPKSAESAIAFFMLKTFSCLSQRLIY